MALSNQETIILIENVKQFNCGESLKKIAAEHFGYIYRIYKKYSKPLESCGYSNEDFNTDKDSVLYDAILSFDKNRGSKFCSWLCENIKYFCLNKLNECKKMNRVNVDSDVLTAIIDNEISGGHAKEKHNDELINYINFILNQISDERIKKVFELRYLDVQKKKTWKEIAEKLGMSHQTCVNLHRKGVRILKNKLLSNDTYDKI